MNLWVLSNRILYCLYNSKGGDYMYIEKIAMPREVAYMFNHEFNLQIKSKGFITLEEVYYLLLLIEIEKMLFLKK